jgi:predicted PurR-regulated permease PerM
LHDDGMHSRTGKSSFIAIIAIPALQWLQRKRVPNWLAVTIILLVLLEIGSLLALVLPGELEAFRDGIPGYQERLSLLSEQLGGNPGEYGRHQRPRDCQGSLRPYYL